MTIQTRHVAITIAAVTYGGESPRIPGISLWRSRPSDGIASFWGPRWRGRPRSSLGARLRSREPQYGHSVM